MDPEFGDDLLNGFSDTEIDYGEGDSAEEREEDRGLDLLTAMLEGRSTEKRTTKAVSRKRSSLREDDGCCDGVKRRKVAGERERLNATEETVESSKDDVNEMKARLKEMEKEMTRLREEVKKANEVKEQTGSNAKAPPFSPPTLRTEARRLPKNGEKKRIARKSTAGRKKSSAQKSSGAAEGSGVAERSVANDIIRRRREDEQSNVVTEKYSKLRIKNPLISSDVMRQRMSGRKMISIPKLSSKVKDGDIEGDWVTMGVVVDKLPPRDTVKGDKYAIWKLSDLSSQTAVISLFLFGKSYQEHWKTSVGTVVALLNPNIMPAKEGGDSGSGLRFSSVALSLDNPLKLMMVGVSQDFTVCRAVTKSGKKCNNFASLANGGHCDYHVQSAYSKMRSQRMEFQTGYGPNVSKGKLKEKLFKDSRTDVYYYGGKTFTDPGRSSRSSNERGAPLERMFAPGAQTTASRAVEELRERREAAGLVGVSSKGGITTHEGSEIFKQMLQTQSIGARMLTKHFNMEDTNKKREEKKLTPEKSASELLKEHKKVIGSPSLLRQPALGRGISRGGLIDLSERKGTSAKPTTKASLAKLRALEFVHKNGPLEGKGTPMTKKSAAISKRIEENRREEDDHTDEAKKQSVDSAKLQRIFNSKSSHDWVVKEGEREKEAEYFDYLEKKENIEQKMASVKELQVNVIHCKLCQYTSEGRSELCRKENHSIRRYKATKRCFECRDCHQRCFTYNAPFPVEACAKCGGRSHEATSFYRERKGPKLPTEGLLLRGEEEKFLNSLK